MILTIDTSKLEEQDAKMISQMFNLLEPSILKAAQEQIDTLQRELQERAKEVETHGKYKPIRLTEIIISLLERHEMMTVFDLLKYVDVAEGNLYTTISKMKKDHVLGASGQSPKHYFLLKKGNPELRAMLPKGTKVAHMG